MKILIQTTMIWCGLVVLRCLQTSQVVCKPCDRLDERPKLLDHRRTYLLFVYQKRSSHLLVLSNWCLNVRVSTFDLGPSHTEAYWNERAVEADPTSLVA